MVILSVICSSKCKLGSVMDIDAVFDTLIMKLLHLKDFNYDEALLLEIIFLIVNKSGGTYKIIYNIDITNWIKWIFLLLVSGHIVQGTIDNLENANLHSEEQDSRYRGIICEVRILDILHLNILQCN